MKKIFTILLIILGLQINNYAQSSFELYESNINGDNVRAITEGARFNISTQIEGEVSFYFLIKNTSTNNVTARVLKTATSTDGSSTSICSPITVTTTGSTCLTGNLTTPFVLTPNETSNKAEILYYQGPNSGTSTIEFKVFNDSNGDDFVSFTVVFSTEPFLNIGNNMSSNFSIFPNPANNNFTINYDFSPKSYVEIYNVLGKVVARINPKSGSSFNVDCSKWEKGYYFCRLYNENKVEKTVKLIITR